MTANELIYIANHAEECDGPIVEIGSVITYPGKQADKRDYFKDKEYVGTDMVEGEGVDVLYNAETDGPYTGECRTIIATSVLEHVERPWIVAKNMEDSLPQGGRLIVSAPFIWRYHGYPDDYWRFSMSALDILFPNIEWKNKRYSTMKKEEFLKSYKVTKRWQGHGQHMLPRMMVHGFGEKK